MDEKRLIFIVGMPRSGTKLLRGLLNNHPEVYIPNYETEFFFYWKKHWQTYEDLSELANFQKFYDSCQKIPYFMYLRENDESVSWKSWYKNCSEFTPEAVFFALLQCQSARKGNVKVIGDKSPSYLSKVPELQSCYRSAHFIHITRDVRDYAISMKAAWGKNMYRAAARWGEAIEAILVAPEIDRNRLTTVKYESLLANPSRVLRELCAVLNLSFDEKLLVLNRSTENLGAARGMTQIKADNHSKFKEQLSQAQICRIEALSFNALKASGYEVLCADHQVKLGRAEALFTKVLDGFNLVRAEVPERGWSGALSYTYRYHKTSSNNN